MNTWGSSWGTAWASSWGASDHVHGRVVRRGRVKIWPQEEVPQYDEELAKLTAQIEALQSERGILVERIALANRTKSLQQERLVLLEQLRLSRKRADEELSRLKRQQVKRRKVLQELQRMDEEDLVVTLIHAFYD